MLNSGLSQEPELQLKLAGFIITHSDRTLSANTVQIRVKSLSEWQCRDVASESSTCVES
ncbi:hypothetical protein [Scytonema sp. HK-05]|uniref:hypothetical protein n=1 Tax=Scytonema sp. HK-05 TaxID=1137095 RepID=UPI000A41A036|nr:hypothetical protein [Scytonema sp. HK-05]